MLDVRRLLLLRELATRGTMAAVADALLYSPSAVSQQLTLLERETGATLLIRSGRGVQLSPQADILVAAAAELADTLERAEADLEASNTSVQGRVRVAVFQSAALALMPSALLTMANDYPAVRVEMVQKEPDEALHGTWAREFDVVIAEEYPAHSAPWLSGLDRQFLTTDAIRLAVSTESEIVSLDDARHHAWVMEPRDTASRHFAEQICRSAGFEPDVRYETADLQTQIRLVESGNAVALLPDLVWTRRQTTCRLIELPTMPRRTIFTAQREAGVRSPVTAAFLDALQRAATQQAADAEAELTDSHPVGVV